MDDFDIYFDEEDCDDEGIVSCECCGISIYVGNAMSFVCPECGTEQNI